MDREVGIPDECYLASNPGVRSSFTICLNFQLTRGLVLIMKVQEP